MLNIADILDVTQEDVDDLLRHAYQARADGQASFRYEGRLVGMAHMFNGNTHPMVQAIERLHAIRREDHSLGLYRGDKLRG